MTPKTTPLPKDDYQVSLTLKIDTSKHIGIIVSASYFIVNWGDDTLNKCEEHTYHRPRDYQVQIWADYFKTLGSGKGTSGKKSLMEHCKAIASLFKWIRLYFFTPLSRSPINVLLYPTISERFSCDKPSNSLLFRTLSITYKSI